MRKIFRDESKTNQIYSNGEDFATNDDLAKVVVQINNTVEQLTLLSEALEDYKAANQEEIVTEALNAVNATIDALDATAANLDDVDANTITVSSLAKLTQLEAQIAQITTNLTATDASINDLTALRANIGNGTFSNLTGASIAVQSWSAENFNINNMAVSNKLTANEIEATSSNIGDSEAKSLAVEDNVSVGGKIEAEGNIKTEASVIADSIESSNIEWKDTVVITNAEVVYLEIPHFENGMYAFTLSDNDNVMASVEIFNSVDNYFVRWSQNPSGFIGNIYKYGNDSNSQLYFQIINTNEVAMTLKYGVVGKSENVPAPASYVALPITPSVVYPVTFKDGQKFFKNVDLANQGSTVGTLTMTQTDLYTTADTTAKSYDTTENVTRKTYKPNQSLNTTDDVKFNTVEAPFLNIADVEVQSKFKSKNIYNGPALSNAQVETLDDDTLYLPQNSTSGTTVAGASLHNDNWVPNRNNGPTDDGEIHYYGSSFTNTVDGNTFIVDEYPPQEGYSLDPNPTSTLHAAGSIQSADAFFWHALVVNNRTNKKYIFHAHSYYAPVWYIFDIDDIALDGTYSSYVEIAEPIYTDSTMSTETNWGSRYNFGYYNNGYVNSRCPVEGEVFYINSSNPAIVGDYTVIYPHICVRTTEGIAYTKGGVGGSIFRKTTKDNATQLLPIIPYEEQDITTDDTHPLVYNSTKDAIEKSIGDITIDGDLSVGGDATITGDVTANDVTANDITATDATLSGDLSVTGAAEVGSLVSSGNTVIHGDLYVDGTTHTTTEESISTSGDTIVLRQNNNTSLGATYAGIVVNKYNGTSELALVTNSDGTLRVGTGTGTDTVYQNIYWDDDTSKWYSDSALTTEVNPVGSLISWGSVEQIGDVKHYTDAVFNQVTFDGLVPLLARDEDANMTDQSLLKYDSATRTAKSVTAATNNTYLHATVNSNGTSYSWEPIVIPEIPQVFTFATMAAYEAVASTVPNGSTVIITNENNYVVGE